MSRCWARSTVAPHARATPAPGARPRRGHRILLGSLTTIDYLIVILLAGAFVLGFAQGLLRQVVSVFWWLIAFVIAAQLRTPVGAYLGGYWTTLAPGYSEMIAFGLLFLVIFLLANVLTQLVYKPTPVAARLARLDDVLGGVVGVFVAVLIMASVAVMLDSFYAVPHSGGNEVTWIQDLNGALRDSAVVSGVRGAVVPPVLAILGPLVPAALRRPY
jgi:uncharacterized membrane protein required for colicin V production